MTDRPYSHDGDAPAEHGWYRYATAEAPLGAWRWWGGTHWGPFADDIRPERGGVPVLDPSYVFDARDGSLTQRVDAPALAPRGVVTLERKRTSHGLHLALTVLTGGVWGVFVWGPITLWHKFGPRARTVTRLR